MATEITPHIEQFLQTYGADLQRLLELKDEGKQKIDAGAESRRPTVSEIQALERVLGSILCSLHPFDTGGNLSELWERAETCRIARAYKDLTLVTSNLLNLVDELAMETDGFTMDQPFRRADDCLVRVVRFGSEEIGKILEDPNNLLRLYASADGVSLGEFPTVTKALAAIVDRCRESCTRVEPVGYGTPITSSCRRPASPSAPRSGSRWSP